MSTYTSTHMFPHTCRNVLHTHAHPQNLKMEEKIFEYESKERLALWETHNFVS